MYTVTCHHTVAVPLAYHILQVICYAVVLNMQNMGSRPEKRFAPQHFAVTLQSLGQGVAVVADCSSWLKFAVQVLPEVLHVRFSGLDCWRVTLEVLPKPAEVVTFQNRLEELQPANNNHAVNDLLRKPMLQGEEMQPNVFKSSYS